LDCWGNAHYGSPTDCSYTLISGVTDVDAAVFQATGIRPNGTINTINKSDAEPYEVTSWNDIVDVDADYGFMVGLKSDGTVVSAGRRLNGRCDVEGWTDIVDIAVGDYYTVGLKSDGTLVTTGHGVTDDGLDISAWTSIKLPGSKTSNGTANGDGTNPSSDMVDIEKLKSAKVGDTVTFGKYEQDDNTGNGQEDIEWIVLEKDGNRILVISKYALDTKVFHKTSDSATWETSDMRKWLNNDFVSEAFSENEKTMIPTITVTGSGKSTNDKMFLLSATEAGKYFATDAQRVCAPTKSAEIRSDENSSWTLRSSVDGERYVDYVSTDGSIESRDIAAVMSFVRPAMWIEIE
jgi:hypothetical protein